MPDAVDIMLMCDDNLSNDLELQEAKIEAMSESALADCEAEYETSYTSELTTLGSDDYMESYSDPLDSEIEDLLDSLDECTIDHDGTAIDAVFDV